MRRVNIKFESPMFSLDELLCIVVNHMLEFDSSLEITLGDGVGEAVFSVKEDGAKN